MNENQYSKSVEKAETILDSMGQGIIRRMDVVIPLCRSLVGAHVKYCAKLWEAYLYM